VLLERSGVVGVCCDCESSDASGDADYGGEPRKLQVEEHGDHVDAGGGVGRVLD